MFFNVGGAEILVIAVIALIAVGPEQLPSVLRKVGRTMGQVRSMATSLRDEFMAGADELTDLSDPDSWFGGSGSSDDPVVRRGYADLVHGEDDPPVVSDDETPMAAAELTAPSDDDGGPTSPAPGSDTAAPTPDTAASSADPVPPTPATVRDTAAAANGGPVGSGDRPAEPPVVGGDGERTP